jgi:hypothetical protein
MGLNTRQRFDVVTFDAKDIDSCHINLQRKSPYKRAHDSVAEPFGLCNEARLWKSLRDHNIGCPECGSTDLMLGGGSAASWGDIACKHCSTYIECKSFGVGGIKRAEKGFMFGGSYRWFKAQKDIHHYALVAPQDDGWVKLYKITTIQPDISVKFMSYFNDLPARARLGTNATLGLPGRNLFRTTYVSTCRFKQRCQALANDVLRVFFNRHARIIQKFLRQWSGFDFQQKEEEVVSDWEEDSEDE